MNLLAAGGVFIFGWVMGVITGWALGLAHNSSSSSGARRGRCAAPAQRVTPDRPAERFSEPKD